MIQKTLVLSTMCRLSLLVVCLDCVLRLSHASGDYIDLDLDFGDTQAESFAFERGEIYTHENGKQEIKVPGFAGYCGHGLKFGCSTTFERQYVKENLGSLQRGLKLLRKPGCYKPGVNLVAGIYRSGSTLIFNQARLWMLLATGGDNMYSGFNCLSNISHMKNYPISKNGNKMERSILCKAHRLNEQLFEPEQLDSIIMTHRKPVDSICSRKLRGLFCSTGQKVDDECMEYHLEEETHIHCNKLMKLQAAVYFTAFEHGVCIRYDRLLEAYYEDQVAGIEALAKTLGVCKEAYMDKGLMEFVLKMSEHLGQNQGYETHVTLMHQVNRNKTTREQECGMLPDLMKTSPTCHTWASGHGDIRTNEIFVRKYCVPGTRCAEIKKKCLSDNVESFSGHANI